MSNAIKEIKYRKTIGLVSFIISLGLIGWIMIEQGEFIVMNLIVIGLFSGVALLSYIVARYEEKKLKVVTKRNAWRKTNANYNS